MVPRGDRRSAEEAVRREGEAAGPAPDPAPSKLPLAALHAVPEVFQMRHELASLTRSGPQVAELFRRIRAGIVLDPMTVWWSGRRWIVLEGHHRLEAYRHAVEHEGTAPEAYAVPVVAFAGTLDEAKKEAGRDNMKARNSFSKTEGLEWAWRLYVSGVERSPTALLGTTGASRGTIYNMRDQHAALLVQGMKEADMEELGWWRCRRIGAERAPTDPDSQAFHAHREEVVDRLVKALDKEFGGTWHKLADFFAYGLATRFPQFAHVLVASEHLWPLVKEVDVAEAEAEAEEEAMLREIRRRHAPETDGLPF